MIPLIAVVAGGLLGSGAAWLNAPPAKSPPADKVSAPTASKKRNAVVVASTRHPPSSTKQEAERVQRIREKDVHETSRIVAEEYAPLDNRNGHEPLVTELWFSRSMETSLSFEREKEWGAKVGADLFTLFEAKAARELSKKVGRRVGGNISRRIVLRLTAGPGRFETYRVIWEQTVRRGIYEADLDGEHVAAPFSAMVGLSHRVVCLPEPHASSVAERHNQMTPATI